MLRPLQDAEGEANKLRAYENLHTQLPLREVLSGD
jgi:hypothetical protein